MAAAAMGCCAAGVLSHMTAAGRGGALRSPRRRPKGSRDGKGGQFAPAPAADMVSNPSPMTLTSASKAVYNGIERGGIGDVVQWMQDNGLGEHPPSEPSSGGEITPEALAAIAFRTRNDGGFTVSPLDLDPDSDTAMASSGICVAFDTTHMTWDVAQHGQAMDSAGLPNPAFARRLASWAKHWEPVLETGGVWIGGWYSEGTGELEINLTFVFRPECKEQAIRFGEMQDQQAVFDLDSKELIHTGGSGGTGWMPDAHGP